MQVLSTLKWLVIAVFLIMSAGIETPAFSGMNEAGLAGKAYRIAKADVLEINVWREEDLTRTVTVRNDGKISIPLVDDIQASGKTPVDLKKEIQKRLSEYIENPVVTVIVAAQEGQQFYVMGEVGNIGVYPLGKDLTVVQALALTGGFTEWADKDDIVILRRDNGKEKRIQVDYDEIVSGDDSSQNIFLKANDTVIVN